MSRRTRFEDEADREYREAGYWYEGQRTGLGLEFFDAVDDAIHQMQTDADGRLASLWIACASRACRAVGTPSRREALSVPRRLSRNED